MHVGVCNATSCLVSTGNACLLERAGRRPGDLWPGLREQHEAELEAAGTIVAEEINQLQARLEKNESSNASRRSTSSKRWTTS